jgi:hypothetical protein
MKRNDYATMTLAQIESYFKLLENIKETPSRRSGNDHMSGSSAPSVRGGNGGNRNRGTNRSANRGGNRRNANPTNQAPAQQELHRSNHNRGHYCPHHRTDAQDGSTCPDYQQHLCTHNTGNQEANAITQRRGNAPARNINPNEALVAEDNEEEAYMVILNEEGDEDALIYPWSDSENGDVPEEQPSNPEPYIPDDAPSSARMQNQEEQEEEGNETLLRS